MNKNSFQTVTLEKGEMHIYDFGTVRLHAYQTNDPIDDEVFIFEKNGKAVLLESPCFFDNNRELEAYPTFLQSSKERASATKRSSGLPMCWAMTSCGRNGGSDDAAYLIPSQLPSP